jgi:hypothetical protein
MTKLVFGVNDVPYSGPGSVTTGDVAEILEARYGIMAFFWDNHQDDIVGQLEEALQGKIDNLLMGAPSSNSMFAAGDLSGVEQMFRAFLDNREMDGRVPGVPTQAALAGVSHRMKRPYLKSNPERPSFIDTGQYQSHFVASVEE